MRRLRELRPVSVVGVGLHPYQKPSGTPYTALGTYAVRQALSDAGLAWTDVETAYTGTATTAMGMSRLMYRHLGATGIPMVDAGMRQLAALGFDLRILSGDRPEAVQPIAQALGIRQWTGGLSSYQW